MEFACNDISSLAAGFANPNHAAAAICAMFLFCWGWGGAAVARVAKFWIALRFALARYNSRVIVREYYNPPRRCWAHVAKERGS